jgi:hypothetical protein
MSEYQYYEFRAVERPLTKEQQATLRTFSTRAVIKSRSFHNEYHWGDFKGDTTEWMAEYFDAHVYLSNFGSRALHLRLPLDLVDEERIRLYEVDGVVAVETSGTHLVISIFSDDDSAPDYDEHDAEPTAVLDRLLPLRDELMSGDLRALYLGWLLGVRNRFVEDDTPEPPVPAGLGQPSPALEDLASFLWLDSDLVEVAARNSEPEAVQETSSLTPKSWVASMPSGEKDRWLELLTDVESHAVLQFRREYQLAAQADRSQSRAVETSSGHPLRRPAELLEAAEELYAANCEAAARKREEERVAYLEGLRERKGEIWQSIHTLAATSTASNHAAAVMKLVELRDLAELDGDKADFARRLEDFRDLWKKKKSLLRRVDDAALR